MCDHFRMRIGADLSVECLDCGKTAPNKAQKFDLVGLTHAALWTDMEGKLVT